MEAHRRIITLNLLPEGISDRQDLFELYRLTLHTYIDKAFGWDDDVQQQRFETSYAGKDGYSIA